ncbi:MAG: hypothetical protein JOZ44_03320, partial [Acidobacteria bacterium]|nr:hypothetical protein [Acidobacteriota bacterium]
MKNIIAIVVCIILVVAIGLSLHVSGALGDTANAPGNSVNIPQSTIDAAQSSGGLPDISITLPTTDTSSFDQLPTLTAGCDTSALSGAVARAAGSVGKAVLNQLPYNLGSIYNAATGKGSANINAFGIASQYLNNKNLPPIISDILNDPAVAKAANNAANNFINGLFNSGSSKDVAESVAGKLGVVSGALGTSEIPVADSTLQKEGRAIQSNTQLIQSNTQSIQQDQATQRDVTCIGNVLVRAAANKFAAAQAAAVIADVAQGNGGDSRFPASQADTEAKIGQAVSKYVVNTVLPQYSDSPYLQLGQNAVSVDSQATAVDPITCPVPANIVLACYGDPSRKIQGNFASCGSDYATRMETWYDIETIKQCTLSGYVQAARDLASTLKEYRIQEENTLLAQGNGLMSPTTCLDPGSDPNTPDYNCVNIKTKTPPAVYSSIVANAANSGTKQQSDANQIGGLVGKTFEQLALNELQSLINLTRSTNGAPSYVAQLGQESTTLNSSTLSGTVDTTLKSSIGLEVTY